MAAPPPVLGSIGTLNTMGDMIRRILNDINEPVNGKNQNQAADYLNDAIESVWMSMLLATLSRFSKGPVNQVFAAGQTSFGLVTVPDPTVAPTLSAVAGGAGGARTVYCSYVLVTDSGSTTLQSPLASIALAPNFVAKMASPLAGALDIIGYYAFAGLAADGSDQAQQSPLIPIGTPWVEPAAGLTPAPNAPRPPIENTTADNIFDIVRLDVQNVDTTWTSWLQANLNSTAFTQFQKTVSTATTWLPYVYDFISDRQVEVRPALGSTLTGVFFYTVRPRRLRFAQSRMPYPQFALTAFLHDYTISKLCLGLYEYDAADRWEAKAEKERQRIVYQVAAANFNQNTTVRPFRG